MQRAIIAGVVLGAILAYMGIFVALRKMSFFGDGISHASLAGVAIGILFGVNPLATAVIASAVFGALIYFLENKIGLSGDAVIGIIFTSGMALGALLMSFQKGYQPELLSFLFGNILAVNLSELIFISALASLVGFILFLWRRKLTLLSLDEDLAVVSGVNPDIYKLLLYVFVAITVVLGIKVLGIVLVSAALIIPVSTAKIFSPSFKALSILSIIISEAVMVGGIMLSYKLDLPTGPVIVLFGVTIFGLAFIIKGIFLKNHS